MAISVAGVGALAVANATTAATPALPSGVADRQFLVCFSWARATAGILSVGSGWTQYAAGNSANFRYLVSFRPATGSDTAPTITPSGMSGAQKHMHYVIAFNGVDLTSPWGGTSTWAQNASAEDVGPIAAAAATASVGAVLVMACRLEVWTSVATLTGDSLTWSALVAATDTSIGNALATVLDFAAWSGGAPTLTAKTFDVAGGTNSVGAGMMLLLNAAASAYTLAADGGSLSVTGQAAGLLAGRRLDAVASSHALAGQAAALARGYRVAADGGGYGAAGADALQLCGRAMVGADGSYAVSGQPGGLLQGHIIRADDAPYAVLGQAAGALWGHFVTADPSAFTLAGAAATLSYGFPSGSTLTADGGIYAIGGQTGEMRCGRVLSGSAASYEAMGVAAGFLRWSLLPAAPGSFVISGSAAVLTYGTPIRTLAADPGAYALTGQPTALSLSRRLAGASAAFALAGSDTVVVRTCVLAAFAGAYDLTGTDATLRRQSAWSPGSRPMVRVPRRAAGRVVPGRRVYVVEVN